MDLHQHKLTKDEWNATERPVSAEEQTILSLIKDGYSNVNLHFNQHSSLFDLLKITFNTNIEGVLFTKYFKSKVDQIEDYIVRLNPNYSCISTSSLSRLNSADKIRLQNMSSIQPQKIFEYILLSHTEKCVLSIATSNNKAAMYHYYTLHHLMKASVRNVNAFVRQLCEEVLRMGEEIFNAEIIITNAVQFIEMNKILLDYSDIQLYDHQKQIFTIAKQKVPKLILYTAPTGTGKTLSPLGLSEEYKIIFVCAARHVGLALARSAISIEKKIAFAFGCESAEDIRLHYFSAKEFSKNKRSGGIGKVDNSVGDNVEMMICDVKSYLIAMYYMLAFNKKENIIMYWDEPTISMDCASHDIHALIHQTWKNNKIPNIVLSSATLPKSRELTDMIQDFLSHDFQEEEDNEDNNEYNYKLPIVETIVSHDCKKSIPIINNDGYAVLPHHLSSEYDKMKQYVDHCKNNLTLLRYFDLQESVNVIEYINQHTNVARHLLTSRHFDSVDTMAMISIKIYYLDLLDQLSEENWNDIYSHFVTKSTRRISPNKWIDPMGNKMAKDTKTPPGVSSIYITTKDAYTLTDGPTIYLCQNVQPIASFCIKQANIPALVLSSMMEKIEHNNKLNEKIHELEKEVDFKKEAIKGSNENKRGSTSKTSNKVNREAEGSEITKLTEEINVLRKMAKSIMLNEMFVPNSPLHVAKWAEMAAGSMDGHVFTSNIDETIVNSIMAIHGIEDSWKILLMMGIGVFMEHQCAAYTEIMKQLAENQKLFMIIANTDYIYGTNYQFCHAYLGKDLNLTQEKIIQSMGRVGRNNHQQTYTIRFRDNSQILKLFTHEVNTPEQINMNTLFRY